MGFKIQMDCCPKIDLVSNVAKRPAWQLTHYILVTLVINWYRTFYHWGVSVLEVTITIYIIMQSKGFVSEVTITKCIIMQSKGKTTAWEADTLTMPKKLITTCMLYMKRSKQLVSLTQTCAISKPQTVSWDAFSIPIVILRPTTGSFLYHKQRRNLLTTVSPYTMKKQTSSPQMYEYLMQYWKKKQPKPPRKKKQNEYIIIKSTLKHCTFY